tara:strand:- start:561 stop:884 length:324 start_codon:yes stop_codon:yes gene_type:complete
MSKVKVKRVAFEDTDIRHAQLKVRLDYDGLSQAQFFRALVTGYLDKDKNIISFIKNYKSNNKIQSKRNMEYIDKDDEKAEDLLEQFGIKNSELEDIFDLIAEQHPDL